MTPEQLAYAVKKVIGCGALILAVALCLLWVYLDRVAVVGWYQSYPKLTIGAVFAMGGLFAALAFVAALK